MADGAYLLRFEAAADTHHDRSRGLRRFARKERPLGQHQMDAGVLNAVDGADGACEFAFQCAQTIDVLDEAGRPERIRFVENLIADAATLRQPRLGELHPQPRDLVLRHHDHGAVVTKFVGNCLTFEILDDAGGVLNAEIGEEGRHLRRRDAYDDEREETNQHGGDRDHRHQPGCSQAFQKCQQTLQRTSPSDSAWKADSANIAYGMVSIWLMVVKTRDEIANSKKPASE
jgi:hypothetical protein